MYAIIEIAGKQYKVRENDKLFVSRLQANPEDEITVDRVLLVADGDQISVGTPVVEQASVRATVIDHVKGDKVLVFRKIRRKRFKVKRGHRQQYTLIQVKGVSLERGKAKKTKAAAVEA